MILLDTCVLIFDALTPKKLTATAKKAITAAAENNQLCCSDISLWEISMLMRKKRLKPGVGVQEFLHLVLEARAIEVLPITVEIAALANTPLDVPHHDPADRIIAATAIHHNAALITSDSKIREIPELTVIW